jgi:hypothetical protein
MAAQVTLLMWMRTIMNVQYRHGNSIKSTVTGLWGQGGVRRFYRGYSAAMFQGPLSRFGDTAANQLALSLFKEGPFANAPIALQTSAASVLAGAWRISITPIDTVKTTLQVEGKEGLRLLRERIRTHGVSTMWYGALANASATAAGHFPWFFIYNSLQAYWPRYDRSEKAKNFFRQASIGFSASVVSDTLTNSIRVVKTVRQTNPSRLSYIEAAKSVVEKDGIKGLLGRGLTIRLITNGVQGLTFSVVWKIVDDWMQGK